MPNPSATVFLDHFGLSRPYRFERVILAGLAILLALFALVAAVWMRAIGELPFRGPRGEYFLYLLILLALVLTLVRWPRLAGVLLVLMAFDLTWGAGLFALKRVGLASDSLMPSGKFEPQRFQWHPLLQAVPIPSLKLTSSTGLAIQHTREGTRGKDPAGSLDGKTVIATFGGSTTYDIGAGEGETWPDRLGEALDQGNGKGRYFVVNHGVPGYTTAEHLLQTAFYQTKFGKPPRCAIYYVGWNDLRNAHIAGLDPGYADFHLPSQIDSQKVRRVGGAHVTVSPLLTLLLRFIAANLDTARYFADPYGQPPVSGDDPNLDAIYKRNIAAISAINRQRGVTTIWVGQLLNRERLMGDGQYGWLPLVRDRDLWPMQQRFNNVLKETAAGLGDPYVGVDPASFVGVDFVDQGHFSARGAKRFADDLAPVVRQLCR
ncbi:GDSL-like Lipase/Acylhydrolase family [Rhodospirillales bacterium URHD0017]|nr:GDSL-like Lipase/Acylhydrolase family [Rhodospirillales bacterium URHD0017]